MIITNRRANQRIVTNVAGTSSGDFVDAPRMRMRARSRAKFESPHARVPCTAGCEFSPETVVRAAALQSKSKRSLAAYTMLLLRTEDARDVCIHPDGEHGKQWVVE